MNHEDYISFEQAQILKELGFDFDCLCYYNDEGKMILEIVPYGVLIRNHNQCGKISAPTLSQTAKWLREKKGIAVCVQSFESNKDPRYGKFWWKEYFLPNCEERGQQWVEWWISGHHPIFPNYEEALSDGISKMLELMNFNSLEFDGIKNTNN